MPWGGVAEVDVCAGVGVGIGCSHAFYTGVGFSATPGERHLTSTIKTKNALSLGLCNSTFGNLSDGYSTDVLSAVSTGLFIC